MFEPDSPVVRYMLPIVLAFFLAWLAHQFARISLARFLQASERVAPDGLLVRQERQRTLYDLITSAIQVLVYIIAMVFILGLFIETTTIIWMIGLFSAAFGIGANVLIRDFLTGFSFIFEDTIDVGDKVEVLNIQGVVEKINLRTMFIRATTGELYIVPNGEVRVIRNFSRGSFSMANVNIKVNTADLDQVLPILEVIGQEAQVEMPNIIEPWQIVSTSETVGPHTELSLIVKTRYGKGAESKPRVAKFIQDRLMKEGFKLPEYEQPHSNSE